MYGQNIQANAKVVLCISTSNLHGSNSIPKKAAATGREVCRKKEHSEGRGVEDYSIRESKILFKW